MGLSFNPEPFDASAGIVHWLLVVGIAGALGLLALILTSLAAIGPTGPLHVWAEAREGLADLFRTSLRRVRALSKLTFLEALRRKTLFVFVVFGILFLFAGWFMSGVTVDAELQVKNYVAFVLRAISWLILPVVLLLACWGLPEDIKARSLHTVVTKPVRRHEVVLGRIFGFTAIGTLALLVMAAVGYIWIVRQMPPVMRSQLVARVPIYGYEVHFLDNLGNETNAGINVGDESMFRSFVEGSSRARAIWDFRNVTPSRLGATGNLILESSFQAFRVTKGNMERGLLAQYTLVNDARKLRVSLKPFEVREFRRNSYDVAQQNPVLTDESGKTVALADLLHDGRLKVEVACLSSSGFLGMARPDLFVRLPDRSFEVSYLKGIFNIGLMMFIVIVVGVCTGCFVKGPVATVLTGFIVVVGRLARPFLNELVTGKYRYANIEMKNIGVVQSLINIPTHQAINVDVEDTVLTRVAKAIDSFELTGLKAAQYLFPDFGSFDSTEYVANAFDVPWAESLLPNLAVTLGYCLPWFIVGYFSLKARELEAK